MGTDKVKRPATPLQRLARKRNWGKAELVCARAAIERNIQARNTRREEDALIQASTFLARVIEVWDIGTARLLDITRKDIEDEKVERKKEIEAHSIARTEAGLR